VRCGFGRVVASRGGTRRRVQFTVAPAKAGAYSSAASMLPAWIPAFAGMTK
jgi:hypothetical protein